MNKELGIRMGIKIKKRSANPLMRDLRFGKKRERV
jgi:hypothetical protein